MKLTAEARKAILIGGLCALAYLAVYVARNILSAVTPEMIASGIFTTEAIGTMSSLFFIAYAVGQLINGLLGEKIKAAYMISGGLLLAGIATILFPLSANSLVATYILYGATGFFLAMIYAPMTKVVAENTSPLYAPRCSLGYTFSSLFGSPIAGLMAAVMLWGPVFFSSGAILLVMGIVCIVVFKTLENRGVIRYGVYARPKGSGGSIRILIQHQIIRFTLISAVTGVVRTTVVFWMPTYLSQHLNFSPKAAAILFTVVTIAISAAPFITVFLYERLRHDMNLTIRVCFILSASAFLIVFCVHQPTINIAFLILAILGANSAASLMWTRYCPGLRDTGMVSSATGYLDFISYMAASVSSKLFSNAAASIGWGNLILIWFALMASGILVTLPQSKTTNNL
jgi:OPA family glycerol-3-phosphate transporter-like MFS transporter